MTRHEVIDALRHMRSLYNGTYAPALDEAIGILQGADLSGFFDKLWRGAYERGKAEAVEEADRLIDRAALFNRLANAKTMEEVFEIIHGMPSGLVTA